MRFLFLSVLLLFLGCAQSEFIYWTPLKTKKIERLDKTIGVEVDVPEYLISGYFVGIKNSKLIILPLKTDDTMQNFLERFAIKELEYLTGDKKIKIYPWDFMKKPQIVLKIRITEFYADLNKKIIILEAKALNKSYNITLKYKNYNQGFKKAFFILIKKIAKELK